MKMRLILSILLTMVVAASAQEGDEARQELEKTDRQIELAEPIIRESGNEAARHRFDDARNLQRDAWADFNQRRYFRAVSKTKAARSAILQALEMAKFDPRQVAEELRRTSDRMQEVRPVIMASGVKEAIDLWRIAEGEQETARRYYDARQYKLALKFTFAARQHGRKAFDLVKRQGGRERVVREVERTDQMLERAREEAGAVTDDRILELLLRARDWQYDAVAALRSGELLRALRTTLASRDLLLRAWEMARGAANRELVEQALAETDRLISDWRDVIRESRVEEARVLLERALEHQRKARELYTARNLKPAFQETALARRLLNRAIEQAQSDAESARPGAEEIPPGPGENREHQD
jgi:hypothetical protein